MGTWRERGENLGNVVLRYYNVLVGYLSNLQSILAPRGGGNSVMYKRRLTSIVYAFGPSLK